MKVFKLEYEKILKQENHEGHPVKYFKGLLFNKYEKLTLELKNGDIKIVIRMFDKNDNDFYFNFEDFDIVMKRKNKKGEETWITWKKDDRGHIVTSIDRKKVYLRRLLMQNYYPDKIKEGKEVYHKYKHKFDNRIENLLLVTSSTTKYNRKKQKRMCYANPLPKEIEDIIFPKYIYYTKGKCGKKKDGYQDGFAINCHPMLGTYPNGKSKSKSFVSMKITVLEKLKLAIDYYKELNSKMTKEDEKFDGQMELMNGGIKHLEDQLSLKL
jgi:hypothetical protein